MEAAARRAVRAELAELRGIVRQLEELRRWSAQAHQTIEDLGRRVRALEDRPGQVRGREGE